MGRSSQFSYKLLVGYSYPNKYAKDFSQTKIKNTTFKKCIFKNMSMVNTTFKDCIFKECKFIKCDLSGTVFEYSEITDCEFKACKTRITFLRCYNTKNMKLPKYTNYKILDRGNC